MIRYHLAKIIRVDATYVTASSDEAATNSAIEFLKDLNESGEYILIGTEGDGVAVIEVRQTKPTIAKKDFK